MTCYRCDMCGDLHYEAEEMASVRISYGGKTRYAEGGEFTICDSCKLTLMNMLMKTRDEITKEKKK